MNTPILLYLCAGAIAVLWFARRPRWYTVVYKNGNGEGGAAQSCNQRQRHCRLYNAAQAALPVGGTKLLGWALRPGGKAVFAPGQQVEAFYGDTILYAVWDQSKAS